MTSFFSPSYWLTLSPPQVNGTIGHLVFGFFVLCFVVGIVSRIVASNRTEDKYIEKIGQRIGTLFVTMGLLGVLLFFFSFERVSLFGARFWYPVWLIATGVWAFYIVRFIRRDVPAMRLRDMERKAISKYLPTGRKRKKRRR
ncbi:hypothetical protein HOI18_01270 [Candidatus Uhrbacteria bacterium]|mgnify:CR=1 FL=1|jgi:hypothetical protein|nr:hypothetical protein [Candidatus Uhrbacteria bacterium]